MHGLQTGDYGYTQHGCPGRLASATGPVPASLGRAGLDLACHRRRPGQLHPWPGLAEHADHRLAAYLDPGVSGRQSSPGNHSPSPSRAVRQVSTEANVSTITRDLTKLTSTDMTERTSACFAASRLWHRWSSWLRSWLRVVLVVGETVAPSLEGQHVGRDGRPLPSWLPSHALSSRPR